MGWWKYAGPYFCVVNSYFLVLDLARKCAVILGKFYFALVNLWPPLSSLCKYVTQTRLINWGLVLYC